MSKPESYCDLEKIITDKNYAKEKFLIVKHANNLNLIKYKKEALNDSNISTLGLYRSVIANNKEHKIA